MLHLAFYLFHSINSDSLTHSFFHCWLMKVCIFQWLCKSVLDWCHGCHSSRPIKNKKHTHLELKLLPKPETCDCWGKLHHLIKGFWCMASFQMRNAVDSKACTDWEHLNSRKKKIKPHEKNVCSVWIHCNTRLKSENIIAWGKK